MQNTPAIDTEPAKSRVMLLACIWVLSTLLKRRCLSFLFMHAMGACTHALVGADARPCCIVLQSSIVHRARLLLQTVQLSHARACQDHVCLHRIRLHCLPHHYRELIQQPHVLGTHPNVCCSALGMAWAQQDPIRAPSFRSCRFSEPSGNHTIGQTHTAACLAKGSASVALPWMWSAVYVTQHV